MHRADNLVNIINIMIVEVWRICDPNELNDRTIIGTTHASWYGAPGVLYSDGNDDGSVQRKWV